MIETGKVIEIKGDRAEVALPPTEGCASCKKCAMGRTGKYMTLEAENPVAARVGDEVAVEVPRRDPLVAASLLFGLPLLGMLAGIIAGTLLERALGWDSEVPALVLGGVLLVGSFFLVKLREKKFARQKERRVRIVRVSKPGPAALAPRP